MLSFRDNTDCIAITSLTGPGGSQWFDEDRLCVYLRWVTDLTIREQSISRWWSINRSVSPGELLRLDSQSMFLDFHWLVGGRGSRSCLPRNSQPPGSCLCRQGEAIWMITFPVLICCWNLTKYLYICPLLVNDFFHQVWDLFVNVTDEI